MRCVAADTLLLLAVVLTVVCSLRAELSVEDEQQVSIKTEMLEWDVEELTCGPLHEAQWKNFIGEPQDMVSVINATATQRLLAANGTKPFLNQKYRSHELQRRVDLLSRPGIVLLPASDFKQVTDQAMHVKELHRSGTLKLSENGSGKMENITFAAAEELLAHSREAMKLQKVWMSWQQAHKPSDTETWSRSLELLTQAAELNDEKSVDELWELLSDWPGGYAEVNKLWNELQPLYRSFQGFVRRKLQQRYSDVPDPIPVYLLGSPLGQDWSYVTDIVQPELYAAIQEGLTTKGLGGRSMYEKAQELATSIGLPPLGDDFNSSSVFNASCPALVMPSCADDAVRVFTCSETSLQRYLEAHEAVFRAAHQKLAGADNSYIFRHAERVSGLAEAMANLGSLLATLGAVDSGLVARDGSDPTGQDIELRVLVALRVLPRLPAALAADLCRLRAAPNPDSISTPATLCWPLRREMQGVSSGSSHGEEVKMWDALGDPHFTLHKPYLSEFAGILLQFELLEQLQRNGKKVDSDLSSVLAQGFKDPWPVLLREIGVTSVSADPLRRFFQPLTSLFDDMAPVPDLGASLPDLEESLISSSILLPITTTPGPTDENATLVEVMENSTLSSDAIQLGPTDEVPSTDISSTMFIALAGVVIGIVLVAASLFVVNRRRKSRQVRTRRKIYDPVVLTRHSVGRPASFSPVVAKRLSENEAPPPPLLSTFKETA